MATATLSSTPHSSAQHNSTPTAIEAVRDKMFGFDRFRPGQSETITRLLAGRSVLAVFPTGSGKSLCYQLPALMLDGLTVVISPLIALMKDQIDFLRSRKIPAARLDSSLSREETLEVFRGLNSGRLKILYVSPERLGNERFLRDMARRQISLLAVDEAHCISQWGHNFRPDYLKIARLADELRVGRVLALTATATPQVAADIACSFNIDEGDVVQTGFYRPNLELRVTPCEDAQRRELLCQRLRERPLGPTVVYVTLQKTAEWLAAFLASRGFHARPYHAGLPSEERTEIQDAFMAADEMIVVATIAFGMGIDKSNIRAVYHYNLPKSLESYMQEIGRAGRDGKPAVCEMLASAEDVVTLENFSCGDTPTRESITAVTSELLGAASDFSVSVHDLSGRHDVRDLVVRTLLTYLELDGFIESTGPFYTEFRFQPRRTSREILQKFDGERRSFLESVFKQARAGRSWLTIDAEQAATRLKQPRQRIVDALDYLEQQGELVVQAAGVRLGYRRLRSPSDEHQLADTLFERFLQREQQDVARIAQVVAFAEHDGCLTGRLLDYFGESLERCGHCDRCQGAHASRLPKSTGRTLGRADQEAIHQLSAERHQALATPRQMTRFLCGIASPATGRAKLRQHNQFGRLEGMPFGQVLEYVEERMAVG